MPKKLFLLLIFSFDIIIFGLLFNGINSKNISGSIAIFSEKLYPSVLEAKTTPVTHQSNQAEQKTENKHSSPFSLQYDSIILVESSRMPVGRGVKSVIISPDNQFVYTLNLESMSVYEIDRKTHQKVRELRFTPTQGEGYDYTKREWINSYQEKPVEGCFTHDGKYLWISLHNAGGVVAWNVKHTEDNLQTSKKSAQIIYPDNSRENTELRFIATGKTPKVISTNTTQERLFVSNWHSNTASILDIAHSNPDRWVKMKDIKTGAIPRGILPSDKDTKLFIGNMGEGSLSVFNINNTQRDTIIKNIPTPRHIIQDEENLFISLSSPEKIIKLSKNGFYEILSQKTADDPRTIALSPDKGLLFCTSYGDDLIEVFRTSDLKKLGSWKSRGGPVGVAICENEGIIEAWVCNYKFATVRVFKFKGFASKAQDHLI